MHNLTIIYIIDLEHYIINACFNINSLIVINRSIQVYKYVNNYCRTESKI
jgi:hypothetical protein